MNGAMNKIDESMADVGRGLDLVRLYGGNVQAGGRSRSDIQPSIHVRMRGGGPVNSAAVLVSGDRNPDVGTYSTVLAIPRVKSYADVLKQ